MRIWKLCNEPKTNSIENTVITVDEKSLTLQKAVEACETISELSKQNCKIALCFKKHTGESEELKLIFMCMIGNNDYSIVEVEELSDVDTEYAESVLDYEVDLYELRAVLGDQLGQFADQLVNDKNNPVNELIKSLIATTIESFKQNNNSVQVENKEQEEKIRNMEVSLEDLRKKASDSTMQADKYRQCVDEQALVIKRQNTEIEELKAKEQLATEKLNNLTSNFGSQAAKTTYIETNVDKLKTRMTMQHARIDIEHVLYFKELTACSYINSFIVNLIQYIKINKKKNIICLIYDDAEFNRHKYGRLKQVDGSTYIAGKSLKGESLVVVTDAAPQILEEALTTREIVIVYDRMGSDTDIVVGRNVHKFIVVNSHKEMLEVKRTTQLPSEQFITTFGTDKDSLSVRQIREYKQMSNGGKILSYTNMTCTKNNTETIYERLLFTASMNLDATPVSV